VRDARFAFQAGEQAGLGGWGIPARRSALGGVHLPEQSVELCEKDRESPRILFFRNLIT